MLVLSKAAGHTYAKHWNTKLCSPCPLNLDHVGLMWGLLVQKEEQDAQKEKEAAERRKREEAQKAEVEKRRLQVALRWPAALCSCAASSSALLGVIPGA